ncbi:hypothetical protein BCV72DRAFT_301708 [Rhizopus microsporus var. microsporus]|uniref:BZIP domain-containing protein n=2 Tax=Rhizopus microsporus TaxID=58291 RepID=A0A2G4SN43_RHIZD|nr:uncharacterized protein RHIMIDRAFT_239684 [Rhizopus microsporus ATCC 52813]ORE10532.1 hypothetical protein BCV72DRAFT_301708 [Rhizopus microsporus var. microsporus]PHZ10207.1 hypothetical protein RHIMIDRAFT_239684 [Rhizopus microsporus ATCC 52813]
MEDNNNNNIFADIVSKIAQQGNNPDISFLKDNPEAQTMLLMALLSTNNNASSPTATVPLTPDSSVSSPNETEKRKFDSMSGNDKKESSPTRRVGRKPVTSEDEDSDDPKSKRKAQNRAAQRAFRERKENHVRLLEEKVKELEKLNAEQSTELQKENKMLKEMITKLQTENAALLSSFSYPLSNSVTQDEERPQKIVRASSPISHFDSFSSTASTSSTSHTPEATNVNDILGLDTSLPSSALLDHSELFGHASLDGIFTADPKQFDFFYPLDKPAATTIPQQADAAEEVVKLWDKLEGKHDFDIDSLCDEMKKKAQCNEFNHEEELKKVIDKHLSSHQ